MGASQTGSQEDLTQGMVTQVTDNNATVHTAIVQNTILYSNKQHNYAVVHENATTAATISEVHRTYTGTRKR